MIFWTVIAGALFGWIGSDFGEEGFVIGGIFGLMLGFWLRAAVRGEISRAVSATLANAGLQLPSSGTVTQTPLPETTSPSPEAAPERQAPATVPAQLDEPRPLEPVALADQALPALLKPAAPGMIEDLFGKVRDWLFGGNTIVRAGLVILFLGLVFLARLAASAGYYPIEARLATVAAIGLALLGIGLRHRVARPDFALHLQGGGVAVLYLTVFASAKLFEVMPPPAAFGFMIVFAGLGAALAIAQNSRVMALASFLGGYAVPVLLGGKSETPLPLFSYLTVLNLAILFIAWRKSWRPLNLLGFVASFFIATAWGLSGYEDRHFLICEVFLAITMGIYLATAVLYAHNTPGKLGNFADSTLLFGTALTGFGLQAALVHDRPYASAWSALAFGAAYLALAAWTMRRRDPAMRLLNECMLAIGVGFVTLAIPLALDAKWTSAAWALEGAGAFWVGARQARWMPRAFGLLLQLIAAGIVFSTLDANVSAVPLGNSGFVGAMLVALPAVFTAWMMRSPLEHSGSRPALAYTQVEQALRNAWFLGGFLFACIAVAREAGRLLPATSSTGLSEPAWPYHLQPLGFMLAILVLMAMAEWFGQRRDWMVATWPARLSLPLMAIAFLSAIIASGRHVPTFPDVLFWVAAWAIHLWLLRRQPAIGWTRAVHAMGVWLATGMVADCLSFGIDHAELWGTSWAGVVFLVSAIAVLMVLIRWAGCAAPRENLAGLHWPLDPHARAYWWVAALPIVLLVYIGALMTALLAEGVTDPLPYVPFLNPVDLAVLLALVVLGLWRRMVASARVRPGGAEIVTGGTGLAATAVLAFAALNTIWLRTAHHFLDVGWSSRELAESQVVQTGYSILWTLIAMALMLFARRRAERVPWLAGAVLLGVVVLKLVFVDMSRVDGLARIVAFIGVGVLMLLIGYFVPLPPRKTGEKPA